LAHPGASARAGVLASQLRPTGEGDGTGARGRRHRCGPTRQRERRGGGTALRSDGAGEPAERGRKAGCRWARRPFAAGGPVLGPRGGGLAWAEAGDSRVRLNLARGGWEGAVCGRWRSSAAGIAAGGLWVRDWGWGSGASGSWLCEGATRFT
jgi:hypothetical protein